MRILSSILLLVISLIPIPSLSEEPMLMKRDAWLERMQQKLPAFVCSQSPGLMQCLHLDWPECIDITTPSIKTCISRLNLQGEQDEFDRTAMEVNGTALIQCSVSEVFRSVKNTPPWDPGCMTVTNIAEIQRPIDVVFFQNGAIRVPRNGSVRLANSPFVIHVSSKKGTPGIFSTQVEKPFQNVNWTNPQFLAPLREQQCPSKTLCATNKPFVVEGAPTVLNSIRSKLPVKMAEELQNISSTYESIAQIVLTEINVRNFDKTDRPGSFEYQVTNTETLAVGIGRIWVVIAMNDQPGKAFPYVRIRPIQIEFDK